MKNDRIVRRGVGFLVAVIALVATTVSPSAAVQPTTTPPQSEAHPATAPTGAVPPQPQQPETVEARSDHSGGGGNSTPGGSVMALNPPGRPGAGIHMMLNAHSQWSTVESPSCRPQDANIRCWGTLLLEIPGAGGLSVRDFEVHRVAVGDTGCDGCGSHDDGHDVSPTATVGVSQPVQAMVNGVAVLRDPGILDVPAGTTVQLKIRLTDNGDAVHADQVQIQINELAHGDDRPELYRTEPQTIQQVRIHLRQHP